MLGPALTSLLSNLLTDSLGYDLGESLGESLTESLGDYLEGLGQSMATVPVLPLSDPPPHPLPLSMPIAASRSPVPSYH